MAETDVPTSPPPETTSPPPAPSGNETTERPEWLPEQYETPEAFRTAHDELRAKLGSKTDTLKAEVTKELEATRLAKRPESPDKYEVKAPKDVVILTKAPDKDFKPEEGKNYVTLDTEDPLFKWWQQTAHDLGLDNDGFNSGVKAFVENTVARDVKASEAVIAQQDELFKGLGEHAQARVNHLFRGLEARLGKEAADALDDAYVSVGGIEALEKLLEMSGGPRFSPEYAEVLASQDEASIRKLMGDPDYYNNPEKQKIVEDYFQRTETGKA